MSKDVVYLRPEDSIFDAAKLFSELDIHGLPVVKNDKPVGMITVTDIIKFIDLQIGSLPEIKGAGLAQAILAIFKTLRSSEKFEKELSKISTLKVEDIMTTDLITISLNTNFMEIAKIMDEKKIHRLPVISRNRLVGMVTGVDLMKVLIQPPKKRKSRISKIKSAVRRKKKSS
ncbi:MAG: CBS domain-containing protein [Candidatus Aminicenantes bacterium]|nr:CBS domain-containing protein [Candidatus Aminicenantes bacterium]